MATRLGQKRVVWNPAEEIEQLRTSATPTGKLGAAALPVTLKVPPAGLARNLGQRQASNKGLSQPNHGADWKVWPTTQLQNFDPKTRLYGAGIPDSRDVDMDHWELSK